MEFLMIADEVEIVKTNRKDYPFDLYVDNKHANILFFFNAIPFFGTVLLLVWLITRRDRREGKVLLTTKKGRC